MKNIILQLINFIISLLGRGYEITETDVIDDNDCFPEDTEPTDDNDFSEDAANDEYVECVASQEDVPEKKYSDVLVCLDAGHAFSTPGKRSPYTGYQVPPELDLRECEYNREMVRLISNKLIEEGFSVFIVTPETDEDVSLKQRYTRANCAAAENPDKHPLFISVHANAFGDGTCWNTARGWSCYTTKGKTNSDTLAECMYDIAREILPKHKQKVRVDTQDGDSDWEENFTVIYGAKMPAVLTENFFYTNIDDTKFMLSDEGKNAVVDIHVEGIKKFVESAYR